MYSHNPYTQAGWPNNNPHAANLAGGQPSTGTTLGVLPSYVVPDSNGVLSLVFSPVHPSILYSSIVGPTGVPFMKLNTARSNGVDTTYFFKVDKPNEHFASIMWSGMPTVRISGILQETRISDFLPLVHGHGEEYRTMATRHGVFTWKPETGRISLLAPGAREPLAVITRDPNSIRLLIHSEGLRLGLLELSIVATAILQSNMKID